MEYLDLTFFGNTVRAWLVALLITLVVLLVLRIVQRGLDRRLSALAGRTKSELDDFAVDLVRRTKFLFLLLISAFAGAQVLAFPVPAGRLIRAAVVIALLVQGAFWGNAFISFWITRHMQRRMEEDAAAATSIGALRFLATLALWTVVLLLALENLGVDITALVAGLGIGGIAVALAVQSVLVDLFASLTIVLDKPFVIGDFIIVGDLPGTVEHIGLKTTRVRSLSGEQLVFSNSDLLSSRIRNFKRMSERRVVFSLGVTYGTPPEKLAAVPGMIREIIEAQEDTRFDRAHFKEYGDFALVFEVVYYMLKPDYNLYMDTQQAMNLAIYRRFEDEEIEFAYPTQTIFLERQRA